MLWLMLKFAPHYTSHTTTFRSLRSYDGGLCIFYQFPHLSHASSQRPHPLPGKPRQTSPINRQQQAMAQAAVPPSTAPPSTSPSPIPSKNPLPLSAYQEGQVRDLYYARVRGLCAKEIKRITFPPLPYPPPILFSAIAGTDGVFFFFFFC